MTFSPGCTRAKLRLLEVGVHEHLVEGHDGGEPLARRHVVADLHAPVADDTVERRANGGEREVTLRLRLRHFELFQRPFGLHLLGPQDGNIGVSRLDRRILGRHLRLSGVASGARGIQCRTRAVIPLRKCVRPLEVGLGALERGLDGVKLSSRLHSSGLRGLDLRIERFDH